MSFKPFVLTSLALAAALWMADTVRAQPDGSSYPYRGTAPGGYRGSDVNPPQSAITPNTVSRSVRPHPRQDPDHSFYNDELGAGMTGDRSPGFLTRQNARTDRAAGVRADTVARIRMFVPEDALVWVDGTRTRQTGESRQFFSPPLTPGKKYYYDVRVQWMKDGEPMQQRRRVSIAAGARVEVDFTRPVPEKKASSAEQATSEREGSGKE